MSDNNYKSRSERKKIQTESKRKSKNRKGMMKKIFVAFGIMCLVMLIVGAITAFAIIRNAPELDPERLKLAQNPQIVDRNGELITTLHAEQNRHNVTINEIPDVMIDAVLSVEDVRFYDHFGLDMRRIGGAIVSNVTRGFGSEGASTITQQVVKNLFLTFDKNWTRKIQEQYLAIRLEQKYSKDQILEMYLNAIYYSDSRYGVAAAADYYFSKELSELTIEDAALLAGIPQRPNHFNPFKNPEAAEQRRNTVIALMERHEKITAEEAEAAMAVPIEEQLKQSKRESYPYQAFLDQVLDEVEEIEGIERSDIYTTGLKIYTTLDLELQEYVEHVMTSDEVVQFPDDKYQAGITLMDNKTGEVLAIGGIREATGARSHNWATNPSRRAQPGSAIKPILDYGPAVDEFKWSTYHQIVDEPHSFTGEDREFSNWYSNPSHRGSMSIRKAMEISSNVVAVKAFQEVGIDKAKEFGERLGLDLDTIQEPYAIGGFTTGVTPFEMAGAYGAFANNGEFNSPHTVRKVEFQDGQTITLSPDPVVAMNDYTAFIVTELMRSVVEGPEGTARNVTIPGVPIVGKTGSTNFTEEEKREHNITNGIRDSWFAGYSPELTAAVWTGYANLNDGYIDTNQGEGQIARNIFREVMAFAHEDREVGSFEMPDSVVRIGIERSTGLLPSDFTPQSEIIYEYFVRGTEPVKESEEFIQADPVSNLTATYNEEEHRININWDYNEDVRDMFSYSIEARVDNGDYSLLDITQGLQFEIDSPDYGATYSIRVKAISNVNDGLESDPMTVEVTIPEEEIDIPDEIFDDEEIEEDDRPGRGNNGENGNGRGPNNDGRGPNEGRGPEDDENENPDEDNENGDIDGDDVGDHEQEPES
ncbi:transglycosylase domain-containing protein [Evansella cellulosilytica]|uniref:Penicillin-binding protein, 1A family n=1 Tax=Evansella cellulosilytica (strain ATCC 21833 / DSM 2522 / FERM P-1141 / JCM 9156 / N-4) TaxID=649639 RepID=E6TZK4_EVAC2|nr:PBP1A family penicillin-binding protein [Evansella cellulosilytica]ADU30178.1 penicillin-binding protein, 1A family [Evansella cellulosilytica DSM 2522]